MKIKNLITEEEKKKIITLHKEYLDEGFFDGSQPRIHIPNGGVKLSEEYQEKINNIDLTKSNS